MSRGTMRSPIRIETLEDRCTPAGTVNVATVLGGINITGDAAANSIRISLGAAAGSIKVEATDADTTITGTPELDATNQKVNVVLGAGNDHLEITGGLNLEQLVVNLGTGNNEFSTSGPFAVAGDMKVLQAGTAGITSTATINLGPGPADSLSVGGSFSYQSTGVVDDTISVGSPIFPSQITGLFSALMGAGNNTLNVRASQLGSLNVVDQSAATANLGANIVAPTINGDVRVLLGRGDGSVAIQSSTIGGGVSVSNLAAKQSVSVAVTGNTVVSENFTVNLGGSSGSILVRANGVFGNVSLTNRAAKSATIDANIVTITGSSFMNASQPATEGDSAVVDATLTSSFIQKDLRATTSGPGSVTTALNLNTLGGRLQATSRGANKTGDFLIHSARINNDVRITASGLNSSDSDLGEVLGSTVVTITGTTFANLRATTLKSSIITVTGASVAFIEPTNVTESLTVTLRDVDTGRVRSTGDIGGDLKVTSNKTTTTVAAGDVAGNLFVNTTNTDVLNVTVDNVSQNFSVKSKGVGENVIGVTGNVTLNAMINASNASGKSVNIVDLRGGSSAVGLTAFPGMAIIANAFVGVAQGPATFSFTDADAAIEIPDAKQDVTLNTKGVAGSVRNVINDSAIAGNLKINQTGVTSIVEVNRVNVSKDLIQRALTPIAETHLTGGSVAGTASFLGALFAGQSHKVTLDDITLNNVVYTGGSGDSSLKIDTAAGAPLISTNINGNLTANLGGGNDEIWFGDLDGGITSPTKQVIFAPTSVVNINGGPGDDVLRDINGSVSESDMTLLSITYTTSPP